jgi:hypothetical protein
MSYLLLEGSSIWNDHEQGCNNQVQGHQHDSRTIQVLVYMMVMVMLVMLVMKMGIGTFLKVSL